MFANKSQCRNMFPLFNSLLSEYDAKCNILKYIQDTFVVSWYFSIFLLWESANIGASDDTHNPERRSQMAKLSSPDKD